MNIPVNINIIFSLISFLLVSSAINLIVAKNPIHSVLYLIVVFVGVSGLLILLKVEFLGMIFLIIYIGAISVLFLFIIMMLNIRMIELRENLLKYVPISFIIGFILLIELFYLFNNFDIKININNYNMYVNYFYQNYQTIPNPFNLQLLGFLIYTYYVDYFMICGLILFVAMIGTIVLTLNVEFNSRKQDLYLQINRNMRNTILHTKIN